jgi:hypothetical protein
MNQEYQSRLDPECGWKGYFQAKLTNDFVSPLPFLGSLFEYSRRGSLNKEEGGVGVLEFPFERSDYGPRRNRHPSSVRRAFQTQAGEELKRGENEEIAQVAAEIPDEFRGWAIKNADDVSHYTIQESDVSKTQTIEPPSLRNLPAFFGSRRTKWTPQHDLAVEEMKSNSSVRPFIDLIENVVGLNEKTLPRKELWIALREPYAGELIIPRKLRSGHYVIINPYAFVPEGRQIRISSNFITYGNCLAIDKEEGLDRKTATTIISAFLISSFGQIQFEREGYNREGCRSVEKEHLSRIRVVDPRVMTEHERVTVIQAFERLPFPITTDRLSNGQDLRNLLDEAIADILCRLLAFDKESLLTEAHASLDEWLEARMP